MCWIESTPSTVITLPQQASTTLYFLCMTIAVTWSRKFSTITCWWGYWWSHNETNTLRNSYDYFPFFITVRGRRHTTRTFITTTICKFVELCLNMLRLNCICNIIDVFQNIKFLFPCCKVLPTPCFYSTFLFDNIQRFSALCT